MEHLFTPDDVAVAYRKAKFQAELDKQSATAFAFSSFEADLGRNLERILYLVNSADEAWWNHAEFHCSWTAIPKELETPREPEALHFFTSDPFAAWKKERSAMQFRDILLPSVSAQVVSALWCITAGERFDAVLPREHVFGNRLRRVRCGSRIPYRRTSLNRLSFSLFENYPASYGAWQRRGLLAISRALAGGEKVFAITMDFSRFYHMIDPSFLLEKKFLGLRPKIRLRPHEKRLTRQLLESFALWGEALPNHNGLGVPVGLTASPVIANVILREFDRETLETLSPLYYGRYVDDVFLVLKPGRAFGSVESAMGWLCRRYGGVVKNVGDGSTDMEVKLRAVGKSQLRLNGGKQRVFVLRPESGLDLIRPIQESLRARSSEHRDLAVLPTTEAEMAGVALLSADDARLEADALRKADAVSIRRSGMQLLLARAEAYGSHLRPEAWRVTRQNFLRLMSRNLLTPRGYMTYYRYIPRLIGLAARCEEEAFLNRVTPRLRRIERALLLAKNAEAERGRLRLSMSNVAQRGIEVLVQVVAECGRTEHVLRCMRALGRFARYDADSYQKWLECAESFRRSGYAGARAVLGDWLDGGGAVRVWTGAPPETPPQYVPQMWGFDHLRRFADSVGRQPASWLPVVFPASPVGLSVVSRLLLNHELGRTEFARVARALTGTFIADADFATKTAESGGEMPPASVLRVRCPQQGGRVRVVLPSLATSVDSWRAAVLGVPRESEERFGDLNRLINHVLRDVARWRRSGGSGARMGVYLVLPELSVPRRWSDYLVRKLGACGVSLIAGLEYGWEGMAPVNEVVVALTTGRGSIAFRQRKRQASWEEEVQLKQHCGVGLVGAKERPSIVVHGSLRFGVLICSDFTDLANRHLFQGRVDLLFVPEWNQDTRSFGSLVESAALDLHCFVVQANNREFGDSRIRAPFAREWERDVVRLKGGVEDFYVASEIDFGELREFQTSAAPDPEGRFKPFPIGFLIDPARRKV